MSEYLFIVDENLNNCDGSCGSTFYSAKEFESEEKPGRSVNYDLMENHTRT